MQTISFQHSAQKWRIQLNGAAVLESVYNVEIENFVCDTPARSFIKLTKGRSGYYGFVYCELSGEYYKHSMTFPESNVTQRTDVRFDEMACDEHHRGVSSLGQ